MSIFVLRGKEIKNFFTNENIYVDYSWVVYSILSTPIYKDFDPLKPKIRLLFYKIFKNLLEKLKKSTSKEVILVRDGARSSLKIKNTLEKRISYFRFQNKATFEKISRGAKLSAQELQKVLRKLVLSPPIYDEILSPFAHAIKVKTYYDRDHEADILLGALARDKGVVYSKDKDSFLFGANKVIYFDSNKIFEVNKEENWRELEINSHEEFVDIVYLSGNDYCSKLKGVGPSTAKKILKFKSVIEHLTENSLHSEILEYDLFKKFIGVSPEINENYFQEGDKDTIENFKKNLKEIGKYSSEEINYILSISTSDDYEEE